ncbi:MAG TPA: hypothetical protein VK178_07255 [Opitutaceae bacterium]|nr:hypothetical protein [Opitutaceae bacterium]
MATIYPKTASDKCIILEPREAFIREMNIPTNWTVLDLVLGLSFTTTSDANAQPPIPSYIARSTHLDTFFWGVKDGSNAAPGYTGSQFLGVSAQNNTNFGLFLYGAGSVLSLYSSQDAGTTYHQDPQPTVTSGSTVTAAGNVSENLLMNTPLNPEQSTAYFRWIAIKLTRNGTSLAVQVANSANQTDASTVAMRAWLANTTWSAAIGSVAAATTAAIRHFYFRTPMLTSRARIHNYGYRLVS